MELIIVLVVIVIMIFLIRLFGAWMLRIDEVINLQKSILMELEKANSKNGIE